MADTKLHKLIMTVKQAQHMLQLLEQNAKGYDRPQLRKLDRIAEMIDDKVAKFTAGHELLLDRSRLKLLSATAAEAPLLQREYDAAAKELNEREGAAQAVFLLDKSQTDFIRHGWSQTDGFRGFKEIRQSVIAIDDALDAIKAVAVEEATNMVSGAESGKNE